MVNTGKYLTGHLPGQINEVYLLEGFYVLPTPKSANKITRNSEKNSNQNG